MNGERAWHARNSYNNNNNNNNNNDDDNDSDGLYARAQAVLHDMITAGRSKRPSNNLADTHRLVVALGLEPALQRIRFVHIAGTKGKGTTAAYTAALLRTYSSESNNNNDDNSNNNDDNNSNNNDDSNNKSNDGGSVVVRKVGLFTSPHLVDVRERILVDNAMLPRARFARHFFDLYTRYVALKTSASELQRDAAHGTGFFRFLFLLALHIFDVEGVDVAVVEVGIGGRLDATNVVPARVCVITALGYDHMAVLGDAVTDIAREKAGILKRDVVCFAAPQHDHPSTRAVLCAEAKRVSAALLLLDAANMPFRTWPPLAIGGAHAIEDSQLALMAARYVVGRPPLPPLTRGEADVLTRMTLAGRSHVCVVPGATLYLDGAHTPESLHCALRWFIDASAAQHKQQQQQQHIQEERQHERDAAAQTTTTPRRSPRRVLVFYTSREPARVLKPFMPHIHHFDHAIFATLRDDDASVAATTTTTTSSMATDNAQPSDAERTSRGSVAASPQMVALTEAWRTMYREVPCLPHLRAFASLRELVTLAASSSSLACNDNDNNDSCDVTTHEQPHVFVCGSFYLVGDVLRLIDEQSTAVAAQSRCDTTV